MCGGQAPTLPVRRNTKQRPLFRQNSRHAQGSQLHLRLFIAIEPVVPSFGSADENSADFIVVAGRVWTGEPAHPWAEGVAARDGVIVKVGGRDHVLRLKSSKTIVIDRPGAFALPGLIDAHGHVESLGASFEQVDLRGVGSLEEVCRRVKERLASVPGDTWITGGQWDQSVWPGGTFPTAAALDAVTPDRPVWLTRVDGHAGWDNSAAMSKAGVGPQTLAPADGKILPVVFIDGAMGSCGALLFEPYHEDPANKGLLLIDPRLLEAVTETTLRHGWQVATHAIGDRLRKTWWAHSVLACVRISRSWTATCSWSRHALCSTPRW